MSQFPELIWIGFDQRHGAILRLHDNQITDQHDLAKVVRLASPLAFAGFQTDAGEITAVESKGAIVGDDDIGELRTHPVPSGPHWLRRPFSIRTARKVQKDTADVVAGRYKDAITGEQHGLRRLGHLAWPTEFP